MFYKMAVLVYHHYRSFLTRPTKLIHTSYQNVICLQKYNFWPKMMVKSGLEKFVLKSLHAKRWLVQLLNF